MNIKENFNLYYSFYIVASEMSFSKAASKYLVDQSNLSREVKDLEKKLNLSLLDRNNKGINNLTADGKRLFDYLDDLMRNHNNFMNNYVNDGEDVSGELIIGTTRNIADNRLADYLNEFYKLYPKVKIKVFTDNAKNLNEFLLSHKIDVLIDYLPNINFGKKEEMEIATISKFETAFACSKNYYDKYSKDIKSLKDLNKYKLVIPGSSRRKQMLDEVLQPLDIKLKPIIEMPDSKCMAEFIKKNDCIGYFIREEIEQYDLVALDLKELMPINYIGIIYHKSINNITKKFVESVLKTNN